MIIVSIRIRKFISSSLQLLTCKRMDGMLPFSQAMAYYGLAFCPTYGEDDGDVDL